MSFSYPLLVEGYMKDEHKPLNIPQEVIEIIGIFSKIGTNISSNMQQIQINGIDASSSKNIRNSGNLIETVVSVNKRFNHKNDML